MPRKSFWLPWPTTKMSLGEFEQRRGAGRREDWASSKSSIHLAIASVTQNHISLAQLLLRQDSWQTKFNVPCNSSADAKRVSGTEFVETVLNVFRIEDLTRDATLNLLCRRQQHRARVPSAAARRSIVPSSVRPCVSVTVSRSISDRYVR